MKKLLEIDQLRLICEPAPECICGVYFLFDSDDLVYVGQSTDVIKRLRVHAEQGKVFDRYSVIQVPSGLLDGVERAYIQHYRPALNITHLLGRPKTPRQKNLFQVEGVWHFRLSFGNEVVEESAGTDNFADAEDTMRRRRRELKLEWRLKRMKNIRTTGYAS